MSSKKKIRHQKYLERQGKRDDEIKRQDIMKNGSIEEIAKAMGIKLK